jgi:hypothetical protein
MPKTENSKMSFSLSTTIYNELREEMGVDPDIPCSVEFNYRPGYPGRLSGLPENCYHAEPPELEITSVTSPISGADLVVPDVAYDQLEDECFDHVGGACGRSLAVDSEWSLAM